MQVTKKLTAKRNRFKNKPKSNEPEDDRYGGQADGRGVGGCDGGHYKREGKVESAGKSNKTQTSNIQIYTMDKWCTSLSDMSLNIQSIL